MTTIKEIREKSININWKNFQNSQRKKKIVQDNGQNISKFNSD